MARRLVVIGGDAAGMTAASQARRGDPDLEIIALEKGDYTSYSACGIPYHVAGDVEPLERLVIRTPQQFRDNNRIDVRTQHEVMGIDLEHQRVEVRDHDHGRTLHLSYDELFIGTGARPLRPPIDGIDGPNVAGVQTLDDGAALLARAEQAACQRIVVVGAGYIGLEMAEAFARWGAEVTIVEAGPQVMRTLDPDMADMVRSAIERHEIEVRLDTPVTGIEDGAVHTTEGDPVPADLVVLGLGVTPNSDLARDAGIGLGARGAIAVDRRQRTDAPGVWSAGDCAETFHLVSRAPIHVALGTVANRTARVAGINLGGGYATFPGVVGSAITKICSTEIGRTGLTEAEAVRAGFGYVTAKIESHTKAGYFPGAEPMHVKVLAEVGSGRLLGAQIVGGPGSAKRIDTLAMALTAGFTCQQVVDADLSYAPPFSPVWDPVQAACRVVLGKL